MHTEFIAYATGSRNSIGADAGISVFAKVMEDGILREENEIARWTAENPEAEIDGDDEGVNLDDADEQLERLGYVAGTWTWSGGQWAAQAEKIG